MTSETNYEGFVPGYVHALLSNFTNNASPRLSLVLKKPTDSIRDGLYNVVHNAAHPTTRSASIQEMTITEAPLGLDALPVDNQQDPSTGQEPECMPVPAAEPTTDSWTSEPNHPSESPESTVARDNENDGRRRLRSKLMKNKLALLTVGVLSFVITPGLVLGIATKQLLWGVALSGLLATIFSIGAAFCFPRST